MHKNLHSQPHSPSFHCKLHNIVVCLPAQQCSPGNNMLSAAHQRRLESSDILLLNVIHVFQFEDLPPPYSVSSRIVRRRPQVLRFPSNHSFIVDFPLMHVLLNLLCLPLASSLVVLCLDIHIFPDCSFVHPIIPCVCSLYCLSIQSWLPVPLYWVDYYIRHRSFFIWTSSLLTPSPTLKLFKNHPSTLLLSTLLPTCSYNHRAACVTLFLSGHYIVAAQPRSSVTMYEHVPFALITVAS